MTKFIKLFALCYVIISTIGCSSVKYADGYQPLVVKTDLVKMTFSSIAGGGSFSSGNRNIRKGSLYAATKEITNLQYRTFLNDLKSKGNLDLYKKCMYDSTIWISVFKDNYNEPMTNNYHHHQAYDQYPIVNIPYQGAKEYCKWITEQYMATEKREYNKVEFMLPTERQWLAACAPLVDNTLPWYGMEGYNANYEFYTNIKFRNTIADKGFNYVEDGGFNTLIVGHYKPNRRGVFDIIGNVAEMTDIEGIQKGGSWDNLIEECSSDKKQTFNSADPRVGFRVYMKVIEK